MIILSEVSQRKKYSLICLMMYLNLKKKNDADEFIYKTEADSQNSKRSLQLPKGKIQWGGIN